MVHSQSDEVRIQRSGNAVLVVMADEDSAAQFYESITRHSGKFDGPLNPDSEAYDDYIEGEGGIPAIMAPPLPRYALLSNVRGVDQRPEAFGPFANEGLALEFAAMRLASRRYITLTQCGAAFSCGQKFPGIVKALEAFVSELPASQFCVVRRLEPGQGVGDALNQWLDM